MSQIIYFEVLKIWDVTHNGVLGKTLVTNIKIIHMGVFAKRKYVFNIKIIHIGVLQKRQYVLF